MKEMFKGKNYCILASLHMWVLLQVRKGYIQYEHYFKDVLGL